MTLVASGNGSWRNIALAFAPTVLPIAAAYEVAHNYPFVIENAWRLAAIAWSIAVAPIEPAEPLAWLALEAFWGSQVLLVVAGHVVAVVVAPPRGARSLRDARAGATGSPPARDPHDRVHGALALDHLAARRRRIATHGRYSSIIPEPLFARLGERTPANRRNCHPGERGETPPS